MGMGQFSGNDCMKTETAWHHQNFCPQGKRQRESCASSRNVHSVLSLWERSTQHRTDLWMLYMAFPNLADLKPEKWKEYFSCCHLDINKINKHQLKPLLKGHFECEKSCNCLKKTFTLQRKSSKEFTLTSLDKLFLFFSRRCFLLRQQQFGCDKKCSLLNVKFSFPINKHSCTVFSSNIPQGARVVTFKIWRDQS